MYKIIDPAGWDWHGEPVLSLVHVSRRGLRGNDLADFRKRASDDLVRKVAESELFPDETLAHILAVADTETTGFNRKGDGFTRKTCNDRHGTFVKFAKWYRNHIDDDPENSYGRVAASIYNQPMGRIELLGGLNSSKTAAERNKGKIASYEMNILESGDNLPVSMGCRVAHDVCSACNNKAKTAADYCDEDTCPAGGCKHYLGKLRKIGSDLHQLGVYNPDPWFVDISTVFRPAGRTSYATLADYTRKAASDGTTIGSALQAELLGARVPAWLMTETMGPDAQLRFKIASILADTELSDIPEHELRQWHCELPELSKHVVAKDVPSQLATLASRGIFADLPGFAVLTGQSDAIGAALRKLGTAYKRARDTADSYDPNTDRWATADDNDWAMTHLASKLAGELGVEQGFTTRAIRSSVSCVKPSLPAAVDTDAGRKLADDYANYRIASLARYLPSAIDVSLTLHGVIAQDRYIQAA